MSRPQFVRPCLIGVVHLDPVNDGLRRLDDVRWLSPDAAATLLTYEHDRRFPSLVG